MAYDETNKRIKEFEDEQLGSTKAFYLKLKLYNENKEYIVDLKTRKCNITTPRHPFHPYGVPPGSEYKSEAIIGAAGIPGESVVVADFAGKVDNTNFGVAVTEPSCFPVGYAFFSDEGLEETRFYDMQSGISDPQAFDIPKECQSLI